ncbi:MAG TPA: hypothetical protein VMR25_21150 [Planctomycetaceae bacterium]|jgi:hypothetical protein|nr:hypothetical protein [Planctomycetaceae bacterium]
MADSISQHSDVVSERASSRPYSALAWDGLLPLGTPMSTLIARALFPPGHIVEVIAAICMPMIVALVRAAIAQKQLERACNGMPTWFRTIALALAITLLLLFEIAAGIMTFGAGAPPEVSAIAVILYCAYLAGISFSLRPAAAEERLGSPDELLGP